MSLIFYRRIVLTALLSLSFSACAQGIIRQPPSITNNSIISYVTITRDSAFLGSALTFTFTINGDDIYNFRNGDEYSFSIDPGEYLFGVKSSGGWQMYGNFHEITVNLIKDKKYKFRLVPGMESGAKIQPSSF